MCRPMRWLMNQFPRSEIDTKHTKFSLDLYKQQNLGQMKKSLPQIVATANNGPYIPRLEPVYRPRTP